VLDPSDIVHDPALPDAPASASSQRVCQACHDAVNASAPGAFARARVASLERIVVDQGRLSAPQLARQSSSQLSDLNECVARCRFSPLGFLRRLGADVDVHRSCPVCGQNLGELGAPGEQEAHVRACLEGDTSKSPQAARYLVYKLPHESALIGQECARSLSHFDLTRFTHDRAHRRHMSRGVCDGLTRRAAELFLLVPQRCVPSPSRARSAARLIT
jgi:hypothetical protein